jgi:AcrR family transcriptional regulator
MRQILAGTPAAPDGRRARSQSSRAKIVKAMLDLVGGGEMSPSASQVADLAGVGLRSVYRHFSEIDELYREMTEAVELQVLPILMRPPQGATWQQRLFDIAARRALIFETIMPYRISANARRFDSAYLMEDYRRMLRLETEALAAHLPEEVREDVAGARSLNVILSFSTWRLLRHDQNLSPEEARAVVERMLGDALACWPEE